MENKYAELVRAPHQLSFDITNKCNLRCLHCFNNSGENIVMDDELSDGEVLDFMHSLTNLKIYNLCFCGGETLLRKDLIIECLKILTASGSHASLVSNGILADEDTIKQLEVAGLTSIQFSLDGMKASHDRLRNKEGVFEKVIKAIKYVIHHTKMRLSVAFTPTSFNIDEFNAIHSFLVDEYSKSYRANTNDAADLRMQALMILGRAKENENIEPSDSQYRNLVSSIQKIEYENRSRFVNVTWGDPVDHLVRYKDTNNFINFAMIHANGDIVVSAYLPLIVGNIRKHSLEEYWNSGLSTIWDTKIIQYFMSHMMSIHDMEMMTYKISDINMDGDIQLDVIENNYNDLNLIEKYI